MIATAAARQMKSLLLPLLLGVGLAGGPALAASNPRDALIQAEGQKAARAFSAGDYASALRGYRAIAPLLEQTPERAQELSIVRFNMGRCYDKLGQPRAALAAYQRSLTPALPPTVVVRVQQRMARLRQTAVGAVRTVCPESEARITVEGLPDVGGPCGGILSDLPIGQHQLVASSGAGITRRPVEVRPGALVEVRIVFAPVAPQIPTVMDSVEEAEGPSRAVAWGLTGGAALSLTAGTIFYGMARSAHDDYESQYAAYVADPMSRGPAAEAAISDAYDLTGDRLLTSQILLGTGVALGLASLWWWLGD